MCESKFVLLMLFVSTILLIDAYQTPRGAQVRLSSKGLQYGADIAIQRMEKELPTLNIGSKSGSAGSFSYMLQNIHLFHVKAPTYSVTPTVKGGLRIQVGGVSLGIKAPLYYKYKLLWVSFGGTTNMVVSATSIDLRLDIDIGVDNDKPSAKARNCVGRIGDLNIDFNGGNVIATWILNIAISALKPDIMNLIRGVMCKEIGNLINNDMNSLLQSLPVKQDLDGVSTLDYSFIGTASGGNYFDFLLKGEFLSTKNPQPHPSPMPTFDVSAASDKMVYIWVTDWMLNTVGKVYEDAGELRLTILPTDSFIPKEVKSFLTTTGLKTFLPDAYKKYPDMAVQFLISTHGDPTVSAEPGKLVLTYHPTISVQVQTTGKPVILTLTLKTIAHGKVTVSTDYNVHAEISGFKLSGTADPPTFPVGEPMVEALLQMLIVEKINPRLKNGFPLPKVKDLVLINPSVDYVQDAIRISSDVQYVIPANK